MSKRKGMSLDDKRLTMLSIFHDSSDVFVMKDIEKISIKKGIVSQTVKDVLQSLLDDDMVRMEKIGASNYYWSFPAEASVKMANELKGAEAALAAAHQSKADLTQAVQQEKRGKADSEARTEQMAELRALQQQLAAVQTELDVYRESDPEAVDVMRQGARVAKDAANRWLDNLQALQCWCKTRFQGREHELDSFFADHGVTDTLDYLD